MKLFKDYSMLSHNTFGMDVKASLFVEYDSVEELMDVLRMPEVKAGSWFHMVEEATCSLSEIILG